MIRLKLIKETLW